jgi:hypothetical protein
MMLALFALGIVTAFATGGFIAKMYVSPCVCAFVASPARIN